MALHRIAFRLSFALFGSALMIGACSGAPEEPGDACEPGGDPCPVGTECAPRDGDHICLSVAGQPCELGADPDEQYCIDGTSCVDDGNGVGKCLIGEGGSCTPDNDLCATGLMCAEHTDGTYACHVPVLIRGKVFDASTEGVIAGAHLIAFDELGTAVSDIAISDPAGNYSLPVPVVRNDDGTLAEEPIFTLRASAQNYLTFPGGVRTALPINVSSATQGEAGYVIASALTDVALIPLPDDQKGLPSISGRVEGGALAAGVLVVGEGGSEAVTTVSDKGGAFTMFNVPAGSYELRGYAAGLQLLPASVDVAGASVSGVLLPQSDAALGTFTGQVNIVAGNGVTSVVLVVASTFDEAFGRAEVPRGLRTPLSGAPNVSGSFTIVGVPEGDYAVLAAFENDLMVRDPDYCQGGTDTVYESMPQPGQDITLGTSFKVTPAMPVVSPGASDPEAVSSAPMLQWSDTSGEAYYTVVVYNAFGDLVWCRGDAPIDGTSCEGPNVPSVSGSATVAVPYEGPLEPGMYYQFRATAFKNGDCPITRTEDLLGVFFSASD